MAPGTLRADASAIDGGWALALELGIATFAHLFVSPEFLAAIHAAGAEWRGPCHMAPAAPQRGEALIREEK